jgi:hypothetical protein
MLMVPKPLRFDVTLYHFIQKGGTVSHIVTIQTKVHDPAAVSSACQRLNLAARFEDAGRSVSLWCWLRFQAPPGRVTPGLFPMGKITG